MEETRWVLELIDAVSGPASRIRKSLNSVRDAAGKLQKTTLQWNESTAKSPVVLDKATSAMKRFGSATLGTIANLGKYVAMAGAATAAWAVKSLGEEAIKATAYKENSLISLEVMLKSKEKAAEAYKDAVAFAAKTPFDTQQVVDLYQQLAVAGFKFDKNKQGRSEISVLADAIGNTAAARNMDQEVITSLLATFRDIHGKGKMDKLDMKEMARRGVSTEDLTNELAKELGKTPEEVRKMVSAGQVDANRAIYAAATVMNKNFGGLMDRQSKTITGLWSTIKSRPFEMLSDLDATGGFGKFRSVLDNLAKAMDPNTGAGKKIQKRLEGFFDHVFGRIFGDIATQGPDAMADTIVGIIDAFESGFDTVFNIVKGVYESIRDIFKSLGDGDAAKGIKRVIDAIGTAIKAFIAIMKAFTKVLSLFIGNSLRALQIAGQLGFIKDTETNAKSTMFQGVGLDKDRADTLATMEEEKGLEVISLAKKYQQMGFTLGQSMALGYNEGVLGMTPEVAASAENLALTTQQTVATAQDSHSPSKVFAGLGLDAAAGYAAGLESGASGVSQAANTMMAAPTSGKGVSSMGAPRQAPQITININGSGLSQEELKTAVLDAVSEGMESLGFEMGVAPQ